MIKKSAMINLLRKYSTSEKITGGIKFSKDNSLTSNKIYINRDVYFKFFEEYCKILLENPLAFGNHQLFEVNEEETTLKFSFVFDFVEGKIELEDLDITRFLSSIGSCIHNTLNIGSIEAIACVLYAKNKNNFVLDFCFPSLRIEKSFFNNTMRNNLFEKLRENKVKNNIPEFKGDWETVLQELTSFSLMYGFKFDKNIPPLKFKGLWDLNDYIGDFIDESFSIKNHSIISKFCSQDILDVEEDEGNKYIPIILSSNYSCDIVLPKQDESNSKYSYMSEISSAEEIDMIHHLLPLLSKSRMSNPMYRWQVGRCIYNIYSKDISGLELLNSSFPSYTKENKENWSTYSDDTGINDYLSIRTIGYFAKMDNPDLYNDWHCAWMKDVIEESFNKVELNVAEVMYRLLWLDFLTVGKNDWYRFTSGGTKLIKSISNVEFNRKFNDLIQFYSKVLTESSMNIGTLALNLRDNRLDSSIDKNKVIGEIIKKLGTNSFQRAIEKHCFVKFYREKVDEYFDSNPKLIAWSNVVSEVYGNNIYTRYGKMEDFITMNSDIDYNYKEYSWEDPKVKEVLYWFKTAFVDKELIDCFLKICSSFLYGRNSEKIFYAFCGPSGDNSKSMIAKLLQKVFSVYAVDFPVSVLTDSRQSSSGPSPELAQAKGARIANVAEPDGKIPFMGSLIKRYSGGDTFFARNCNENGKSIEPMFKMILYCNAVPPIEGADEAVERRLVIVPFLSKYCDDAPEDVEEQFKLRRFPKDPFFEDKINLFRKPMLWIMINYFEKYMTEKIVIPKIAKDYTAKYWEENDPYKLFVNENFIHTKETGDKINATTVYKIFKVWYSTNFNARKHGIPELSIVIRHLSSEKLLGEPVKKIWSGWRVIANSDEVSRKHNIE